MAVVIDFNVRKRCWGLFENNVFIWDLSRGRKEVNWGLKAEKK